MARADDGTLSCDMDLECKAEVTMIEEKGWIYCTYHGTHRREYGYRNRKLRPHELNRLKRGQQVAKY